VFESCTSQNIHDKPSTPHNWSNGVSICELLFSNKVSGSSKLKIPTSRQEDVHLFILSSYEIPTFYNHPYGSQKYKLFWHLQSLLLALAPIFYWTGEVRSVLLAINASIWREQSPNWKTMEIETICYFYSNWTMRQKNRIS